MSRGFDSLHPLQITLIKYMPSEQLPQASRTGYREIASGSSNVRRLILIADMFAREPYSRDDRHANRSFTNRADLPEGGFLYAISKHPGRQKQHPIKEIIAGVSPSDGSGGVEVKMFVTPRMRYGILDSELTGDTKHEQEVVEVLAAFKKLFDDRDRNKAEQDTINFKIEEARRLAGPQDYFGDDEPF